MSGWHTVLQDASFKGVAFDVERIEERNGKALAEHARPFVSGVDLEDMGNSGREVQISAVFYGRQYSSRLLKLLQAFEEPGAGVLVHPVWGRLQNMLPASWSYRHEADYVDYAALDVTFREATEAQPIFVFENAFLMELEKLIETLDTYRSAAEGFIDSVLAVKAGVSDLWGSALGVYSGLAGTFAAVRSLFEFNEIGWPFGSSAYSEAAFSAAAATGVQQLADMTAAGLAAEAALGSGVDESAGGLSARQRFDAVAALADEVCAIPADLLSGENEQQTGRGSLKKITAKQMRPVQLALAAAVLAALLQQTVALIENHGEAMSAPDLMHLHRQARRRIQAQIDSLREVETLAYAEGSIYAEGIYSNAYQAAEALRNLAGRLNRLVIAAINQKPPLVVKTAPISGTVHQIAFAFYGDITRADELIQLNPHVIHPAFIERGQLVNAYAK